MPGPWEDSAAAYGRSFARLCAGTVEMLVAAIGPAGGQARVLDVGTGPGTVAAAVEESGFEAFGLDSDGSMVESARRRFPLMPLVRAALPHLPFADATFDGVTANFVVNHTPDPRGTVGELFRVTRIGGRVAATVWPATVGPMNQLWNDMIREARVESLVGVRLPPELDFDRSVTGFADLLRTGGFQEVKSAEVNWTFCIARDDLWAAVEGGVAVIGQTYRAQGAAGRRRLRAAYRALTDDRHPGGTLVLPSTALLASGVRRHRAQIPGQDRERGSQHTR